MSVTLAHRFCTIRLMFLNATNCISGSADRSVTRNKNQWKIESIQSYSFSRSCIIPSGGASLRMRLVRKLLSAGRSSIIFISTYTQQAKFFALSERHKTTQLQKAMHYYYYPFIIPIHQTNTSITTAETMLKHSSLQQKPC